VCEGKWRSGKGSGWALVHGLKARGREKGLAGALKPGADATAAQVETGRAAWQAGPRLF
jgi:hypothetical protein